MDNIKSELIENYWEHPDVFKFTTKIIGFDKEDQQWIEIEKKSNYFYAEGGGQLADKGILAINENVYHVEDVQKKGDKIWLYVPKHDLDETILNSPVEAKIDEKRRKILRSNHSAQHLLTAIFWDEYGLDTTRVEIRDDEVQMELSENPSMEQIEHCYAKFSQMLSASIPLHTHYHDYNEVSKLDLRDPIDPNLGLYRVVEIGDQYDFNACGGTHIKNTAEIGALWIKRVEGKKIRFITGEAALKGLGYESLKLQQVSRTVGFSPQDTLEAVEDLMDKNKVHRREINKLKKSLIELAVASSSYRNIGDYRVRFAQVPEFDKGTIVHAIGQLENNQIAVVVSENGVIMVFALPSLMDKIVPKLRENKIKGGTNKEKTLFMGKISQTPDGFEKLLDTILA